MSGVPEEGADASGAGAAVRILLVDDQALLRLGMRMVLEAEPGFEIVAEAGDGRAALLAAGRHRPDVVLMDIRMPVLDGIEATRLIVREVPASRVVLLTTFDLDEYAFSGLRAGASGFLLKDTRPAELTSAIRSVAAGDAVVSPRIARRMLTLFVDQLPEATRRTDGSSAPSLLSALTDREREVFTAVAEGLSNAEIAARFVLSESTVKTHVGRLLQKLEARDRVHLVILAYENGVLGR